MSDVHRITRSENGENVGIVKASGIFGVVLDPCTVERRLGPTGIGDGEGILGEGVQGSAWIIEQFEGLDASVHDRRGDLQVE